MSPVQAGECRHIKSWDGDFCPDQCSDDTQGIWLEVERRGERLQRLELSVLELSRDFTLNAAADRQAIGRYAEENRRKMDDLSDQLNARFDAQHNWFLGIFIALLLLLLGTLAGWVATLIKR